MNQTRITGRRTSETDRVLAADALRFVERLHQEFGARRIELLQPMPVELPAETQLAWLREHARVAEFSQSFELIDPRADTLRPGRGRAVPGRKLRTPAPRHREWATSRS